MKTVNLNKAIRVKGGKYVGPGETPLADDVADWAVEHGHGEAAKAEKSAKKGGKAAAPKQEAEPADAEGEAAKAEK